MTTRIIRNTDNSHRIKALLVELATADKLPLDMNDLDPAVFSEFDEEMEVGGFKAYDFEFYANDTLGVTLSPKELEDAMYLSEKRFDANYGFDWATMDVRLTEILDESRGKGAWGFDATRDEEPSVDADVDLLED